MLALEIAALGTEIDGGTYSRSQTVAALCRVVVGLAHINRLAVAAISSGGPDPASVGEAT